MENWREFEKLSMEYFYNQVEKIGVPVKLFDADEQVPVQVLFMLLENMGKKELTVKLEICYLPVEENLREMADFNFVQYYATILENIEPSKVDNLVKLVHEINGVIPIGFLGINKDLGSLYLRYQAPYMQTMELGEFAHLNDACVSTIINTINLYIDILYDVANGDLTFPNAVKLINETIG